METENIEQTADFSQDTENNYWGEYRPELLSRRGEYFAWFTTLLVLAGYLLLILLDKPAPKLLLTLFSILMLFSLAISLGNWMDRRSYIKVTPEKIIFENGLRHVEKRWGEIRKVEVHPSKWGAQIRVFFSDAHFAFRTLGVVTVRESEKGRMGYPNGDKILRILLEKGNLKELATDDAGKYYVRKDVS